MSEFRLEERTGFGHGTPVAEEWPGFSLAEMTGLSVWWLSVAGRNEAALAQACEKHLGTSLPAARSFQEAASGNRLIWAGERQWLATGRFGEMPAAIAKLAAATDQSDGWLGLSVAGEASRAVMEKLCGIDLHESVFATGAAARAPIETMIAFICCEDAEAGRFALHFQRSSARSFLDHVRHAAHSTCPRH